ncbi:MAG: S9 family peptidase [Candidatus Aminicenantes bacterium]|nr:S9 family peptidase [Candidatus Aminicenantes bacterium]
MRYVKFLIFGLFIAASLNLYSGAAHPFTVHDLLTMDRISGQTVSPDGKLIVFNLRKTDLDANKGRTDLWLVDTKGKGLRQLTAHPAADHSPCWSKDSKKIYFLSTRSGSSQVWCIPVYGGEARQVTDLPLNISSFKISPDGKKIAFSMDVFPASKTIDCTVNKLDKIEKSKATGKIFERLFIRHWDTWNDGRRSHIFVMSLAGGKPVDVIKGMDSDCPTKPFGGSEEYCFTPCGTAIVFSTGNTGRAEAWSTNFDLFSTPADGSETPRCLTEENKAWDTQPVFSNNGKTLAYLSMKRPDFEADRFYIKLRSWPYDKAEKERILALDWDHSPGTIVWGPKDKTLYAVAGNFGQKSLFAIDVKTGKVKTIVKEGWVTSVDFAGKEIIFGMNNLKSPVELYSVDFKGKKQKRITNINASQLAAAKMGSYEQFTFKGWNDETVYCYVVKPVDFDANKKYPVAFLIHGGPQGSFGNHFHYRWNPQVYTGRGYAAVMVDFHGSTGYGQDFTDSISRDWGGKPLVDLKKGLAAALKRYPWLDGERVGALGASFGGYMVNWIAGNWPDRFRCLVNHDGNLDEKFAYYDTEELWFPEWDHGGTPWDNPAGYEKYNPINFVKNWKTPMLVIHGALDFRVVETQGFATFTALQRRGIPSKLLYFPDENHWVLKPHNSILWHDTVLDWLDQWVKK